MARISRGIQVVKWHNGDGSKSVRYRIRIQRKTFQADKLFDTLAEAERFLADSRSEAGRKVLSEREEAQKRAADEFFDNLKAPSLSWFLDRYRVQEFPETEDIKKLPEQERKRINVALSRLEIVKRTRVEWRGGKVGKMLTGGWVAMTTFPHKPFGEFKLADITPQAALLYIDARAAEVSLSTVKRDVAFLAAFFSSWLPENDPKASEKVGNPFAMAAVRKRLKGVSGRREVRLEQFGEDAEKRLFAELERCRNPEMLQIVALALTTGQRRGEILGLEWARVFPNHIQLRAIDTKSKKPRVVPLSKEAKEILAAIERKPEATRVFSYTADGFKSVWDRVRKRAGLPEFRFHDLRHTFVSRLLEVIASPVAAASIAGYKSVAHFERQHMQPVKDRKELENGIQSERGLMLAVGHADNRMTAHYAADITHKVMESAEAANAAKAAGGSKYSVVVDESGGVVSVFMPDFGLSAGGATVAEALALIVQQAKRLEGEKPRASSPLAIAKDYPGAVVRQIDI